MVTFCVKILPPDAFAQWRDAHAHTHTRALKRRCSLLISVLSLRPKVREESFADFFASRSLSLSSFCVTERRRNWCTCSSLYKVRAVAHSSGAEANVRSASGRIREKHCSHQEAGENERCVGCRANQVSVMEEGSEEFTSHMKKRKERKHKCKEREREREGEWVTFDSNTGLVCNCYTCRARRGQITRLQVPLGWLVMTERERDGQWKKGNIHNIVHNIVLAILRAY